MTERSRRRTAESARQREAGSAPKRVREMKRESRESHDRASQTARSEEREVEESHKRPRRRSRERVESERVACMSDVRADILVDREK